MRPRCTVLTGGFDFSGCGDFTPCPPAEQTEMSNSEPNAIVLHGIAFMRGIIQVSIRMEGKGAQGLRRFTNWRSHPTVRVPRLCLSVRICRGMSRNGQRGLTYRILSRLQCGA